MQTHIVSLMYYTQFTFENQILLNVESVKQRAVTPVSQAHSVNIIKIINMVFSVGETGALLGGGAGVAQTR